MLRHRTLSKTDFIEENASARTYRTFQCDRTVIPHKNQNVMGRARVTRVRGYRPRPAHWEGQRASRPVRALASLALLWDRPHMAGSDPTLRE